MKIKGNTYYFTKSEKSKIKKLIDKEYGRPTASIDYETTSKDYDLGLEGDIKQKTTEKISGSTLERLVGLTGKESSGVRQRTIHVFLQYIGYKDVNQLERFFEYEKVKFLKNTELDFWRIFRNHLIKIHFGDKKYIVIRLLNRVTFEVIESVNSKVVQGDKIGITQLEVGEELICSKVIRGKFEENLGQYKSGDKNRISSITLNK